MLDTLNKLLRVARLVDEEIFRELPHQQWEMFLLVCQNDGINQQEFQRLMGLPPGTVSRNLSRLGTKMVEGPDGKMVDIGYGLVRIEPDPEDPKKNSVYLTERGKEIRQRLVDIFRGPTSRGRKVG